MSLVITDASHANEEEELLVNGSVSVEYHRSQGVEDGDVLRAAVADLFGALDLKRWEASAAKFMKQIWFTDCKSLEETLKNPKCSKHSDKRLSIEIASLRQDLWRKKGEEAGDPYEEDYRPSDEFLTDTVRPWLVDFDLCLGASVLVGACGEAFARDQMDHFRIGFKQPPQTEVASWSTQADVPPHKRRAPVSVNPGDVFGCLYTMEGRLQLWRNGSQVLDFDVGRPIQQGADYYAVIDVCLAAYSVSLLPHSSPSQYSESTVDRHGKPGLPRNGPSGYMGACAKAALRYKSWGHPQLQLAKTLRGTEGQDSIPDAFSQQKSIATCAACPGGARAPIHRAVRVHGGYGAFEASAQCSKYLRLYLAKLANIWTEAEAWPEIGEHIAGDGQV
eukprot:s2539_g14.t1